jgi:long-chain fatty acid transport protein
MIRPIVALLAMPLLAGVMLAWCPTTRAAGLDRNGIGAASMGVGGASVASPQDALARMTQNTASLADATGFKFQIGGTLAYAQGDFYQRGQSLGHLQNTWGVLPDLAVTTALSERVGVGFSLTTDSTRLANWNITDTPGAVAGAQYGQTQHRSEVLNLRAAVGLGIDLGGGVSLGVSVGGVFTRNELQAPYIFQSNGLAGAKTYLDMTTQGFGVNGDVALQWRVNNRLTLGLGYRTPTSFQTSGVANGDLGAQLTALGVVGVDGTYRYDAKIKTALPQHLSAGFAAALTSRWRVMGQVEWINWSAAFSHLDVNLSNGSNGVVNGVAGSTGITDRIALNWKDQYVFRLGTEVDITDQLRLRFGYVYAKSPVPGDTLLPMTAAISEHTLACGLGWRGKTMSVDLAYQYDLPISRSGTGGAITGPEYKDTTVSVQAHWVGLTVGYKMK